MRVAENLPQPTEGSPRPEMLLLSLAVRQCKCDALQPEVRILAACSYWACLISNATAYTAASTGAMQCRRGDFGLALFSLDLTLILDSLGQGVPRGLRDAAVFIGRL